MLPVRAQIEALHGFSAHADRNELIRWLRGMTSAPRCVFVTHGEPETAKGFAAEVTKEFGLKTRVPVYRDEVVLD
jgi:metallo-beta-lactamase family protein